MQVRGDRDLQGRDFKFNFDTSLLSQKLDAMRDQPTSNLQFQVYAVGTATVFTAALSAGYTLWTIRGGYLLASVLSSMPAWRLMDPLPILGALEPLCRRKKPKNPEEEETLESMVEKKEEQSAIGSRQAAGGEE